MLQVHLMHHVRCYPIGQGQENNFLDQLCFSATHIHVIDDKH